MINLEAWDPDWVISPGETLREWIEENEIRPRDAAVICQIDQETLCGILLGTRQIDQPIADKLARATMIPAQLWLNLERAYRQGLAKGKIDASHS